MNSRGIQPYIYTCISSPKPPSHPGCHITEFHVLYCRSLLVIHFKYSSVYMSILSMLPEVIYGFSEFPIKISVATLNNQNSLEKEEQSWRYHTLQFRTILQSYNKSNDIGVAQKQRRLMEQNRKPRNKPLLMWSIIL